MSTRTFFGIPVSGDITPSHSSNVEQWPAEKFHAAVVEVLEFPEVEALRWTQYTPYFNDGEPCEFSVGALYVKIKDGDPEAGDYGDGFVTPHDVRVQGGLDRHRDYTARQWVTGDAFPKLPAADRLMSLASHMGHFEDALRDAFGDHAQVTITRDGIEIEHYEHH